MRNKMSPKNKSLLGNFVNKFCQFVKIFCQEILSTHFANRVCQHILPAEFANTFCQHILSTVFDNKFCQQILSTAFVIAFNVNHLLTY